MLHRFFLPALLMSILLLTLAEQGKGQNRDTLKVEGIPFPLTWENCPKGFMNDKTGIMIIAGEKTDMFRDPNVTYNTDNAPKLLFTPDPDFVLTASVEHSFTSKWDGGAIVLKQDSLNWIKFCFERDYTGARRVVSVVTKNISDDCNSAAINGNKVFYKIAKADNVITLYYSLTGKNWFLVRHFQFDTNGPVQVGFLAQSPTGKYCSVKFRNITYSGKKIKDPYLGE